MDISSDAKCNKRKIFLGDPMLINNVNVNANLYKKNRVTISKECSSKSSLLVKWNYENPCEQ